MPTFLTGHPNGRQPVPLISTGHGHLHVERSHPSAVHRIVDHSGVRTPPRSTIKCHDSDTVRQPSCSATAKEMPGSSCSAKESQRSFGSARFASPNLLMLTTKRNMVVAEHFVRPALASGRTTACSLARCTPPVDPTGEPAAQVDLTKHNQDKTISRVPRPDLPRSSHHTAMTRRNRDRLITSNRLTRRLRQVELSGSPQSGQARSGARGPDAPSKDHW